LRDRRRFLRGKWIVLYLLILIPSFYFSRKLYLLVSAIHEEKVLVKSSLVMMAENELLKKRIDEYRKGTMIEAKARDDLGMIKEGEKIFIISR
jgi:cell division protein FtsB